MIQGGSLIPDKTFKKILSIGYEFETHDIAKLSLHKNKKSLINSNVSLRVLEGKLETGSATEVDNNYISVRIPIHKDDKPPNEKKAINEENEEVPEEFEDLEDMAEFQEEFEAEMKEEKMRLLAERENESYLEYFTENRKTDNKKTIKFNITNDVGDVDFSDIVKTHCEEVNIAKNDMYFFKTEGGKMYDFKFSEEITDSCETFTGVEYIVTYYSPKKENADIIIETFVDACSRIVDHLSGLKPIKGTLLIQSEKKTHYTPIGELGDDRRLYHKPDTNLFYMDTYDTENMINTHDLGDVTFIPQMTFRCKAEDLGDIIKEILEVPNFKKSKTHIESHNLELETVVFVEDIVDNLIENFNETSKMGSDSKKKEIDVKAKPGKILKTYMFLIYYKLFYYIQEHKAILDKELEDYLKDYLSFASRHNNATLYKRVKEILRESFDISDLDDVHRLFWQPDIISPIYEFEDEEKTDVNYESSALEELNKSDKHYGDPLYSMHSYFRHFEEPKTVNSYIDWLSDSKIDLFSTTFPLESDNILIENRFFRFEIGVWLRNTIDKRFSKDMLTLKEMLNIVNKLYGSNFKKLINLEYDPIKKKLTKKCKSGYYRSLDFQCLRMKSRKSAKKVNQKTRTSKLHSITQSKRSSTRGSLKSSQRSQGSQRSHGSQSSRTTKETISDIESPSSKRSSDSV